MRLVSEAEAPRRWHIVCLGACVVTAIYSTVIHLRATDELNGGLSSNTAALQSTRELHGGHVPVCDVDGPASAMEDLESCEPPESVASECRGLFDIGTSVGTPRDGALFGAAELPEHPRYIIQRSQTAYANPSVVRHLQKVFDQTKPAKRLHRLLIGDLSNELGGRLLGHFSHQTGLDVDIGFYYRELPLGYPERFVEADRDNLHVRATLALVEALADTQHEADGVAWILLDYEIQRMLHRVAVRRGMSEAKLVELFQYPAGPTAAQGIVRHFPKHRDHMHVRFKCPPEDGFCEQPSGAPTASEVYRFHPNPPLELTRRRIRDRSRARRDKLDGFRQALTKATSK